jgi:hypothetical protein
MKFLIAFYSTFIILSLFIVLIVGSNEMIGFVFWFNLIYVAIGSIGWLLINQMFKTSSLHLVIFRFFLGLSYLNLMMFFLDGKAPSLSLLGLKKEYTNIWVNLFLHIIFLVSFLVASLGFIRPILRGVDSRA